MQNLELLKQAWAECIWIYDYLFSYDELGFENRY